MGRESRGTDHGPVVAFVGGGVSATLTAVALLRVTTWLRLRYRVVLFDEHGRHGMGAAYSPPHSHRPLDAPAKSMSVFPDQPAHLVEWARRRSLPCAPETLLTRGTYAEYLSETLAETAVWARPHALLEYRTARVVRAERDSPTGGPRHVSLRLAGEEPARASAVVVATGGAGADRLATDPFLRGLVLGGLGRPNPPGLGLDTCPCGALVTASGDVDHRLFAVGPVRGERPGEVPVPEIRAQAERLGQLIADVVLRGRPNAPAARRRIRSTDQP